MNKQVMTSLFWAGAMIASAGLLVFLENLGIVSQGGERGYGVVIGLVLAWTGDQLPKVGAGNNCASDGEAFRMRRFAGAAFMVAGLLHALIWVIAPLDSAAWWSIPPVAIAMVLTLAMLIAKRRAV